jgi:hypothetical protein
VFHSPQSAHWPRHFADSAPQAEQTKTVAGARGMVTLTLGAGADDFAPRVGRVAGAGELLAG